MISENNIFKLNQNLKDHTGKTEEKKEFSECMMDLINTNLEERGYLPTSNIPSDVTVSHYHYKVFQLNPDISIVVDAGAMTQSKCRQMVATSTRNIIRHLAAIAFTHFRCSETKW